MFVLDEADELLSRGYKDQIYGIFTTLPAKFQVIVVSSPMLYDLVELTAKFMNDPVKVLFKIEGKTLEGIRQFYHLNMDAKQCNDAIKEFRTGSSRILVRTDIFGGDIDIPQVSLVINYDLPSNHESYVHRIGRRGAFGRKGFAINFIINDEQQTLKHIEQYYNTQIDELRMDIADLI
ncbi:unnamed protein product [Rotaria sp. Silwood2]|nr:unnamed protein product [Rotaria sp. Silwood2]